MKRLFFFMAVVAALCFSHVSSLAVVRPSGGILCTRNGEVL